KLKTPNMTKVLEYHFNPPFRRNSQVPVWLKKKNQNYYFDGLCFKPAGLREKPLGLLCLLAEMADTDPEETAIISGLVKIIQREYYRFFYPNPTDCFKWALEQGNRFLSRQIKNNNVNWLSKLNFAAFAIRPNLSINLAKINDPAILLFTNGEIFDLAQSLTQESAPFKSFSNTIEGEVQNNDKILILSRKLFETFDEEEMFRWLLSAKSQRAAKDVFKQKKDTLRHSFGVCLLVRAKGQSNPFRLMRRSSGSGQSTAKYTRLAGKMTSRRARLFPGPLQTILLLLILASLAFIVWRMF
ncbi:MAG: hypothetical protein PHU56_04330, partial [Candidatus Pacebacteria bacterium]|nr:hypothetical protein [Candidatus Paceibacterota bacterium]